jgi:2-hydroxy-3-keto-5-methylthiopentenyl-1-phosphate phosphatase
MRLVVDWDGTVTEEDALNMVVHQFGDRAIWNELAGRLGRDLTLNAVIAREVATIAAPLEQVVAWVREHVRVRPGLAELAERYRPLIVSNGFRELIEPVLEREGVRLEVVANELDTAGRDGWRAVFRDNAACVVCGEPCKRWALDPEPVVFVGDGSWGDRCAAVAADRVFARNGLAAALDREGVPYEPFDDLHDVVAALDA